MSKTLSEYEVHILSALALGAKVSDLPAVLDYHGLKPHSMGSVEKKLKAMRKSHNCNTNMQLVYRLRNQVIKIDLNRINR